MFEVSRQAETEIKNTSAKTDMCVMVVSLDKD